MIFFWTAVLIISVIAEAVTTALVAVWFIPGAIVALVIAAFNLPLWLQFLVFFLSSLGIIFRFVFKEKFFKRSSIVATNADSVIGKKAVVTAAIDNISAVGSVKVGSSEWTARSYSDDVRISEGSVVEILEINGVKLICRPVE